MSQSNELRIFISSTFRDLQEEREHLVKKIFPEIRALCRLRGVTFTEIDLRWGLTEESAISGQVVRTCLEEIDKCQPYFIGIVGNRYGWVPEFHEIQMDPDLLSRYPWVEEVALEGTSVTEMEVLHGVLNSHSTTSEELNPNRLHAFFYHRAEGTLAVDDPVRLSSLIERVRATEHPFHEFKSAEELGALVRDDLVRMIDELWPAIDTPSPLQIERRAHTAFAASRTRAYIVNPTSLKEFSRWSDEGNAPLLVHGLSGLGKSSLVAYLADYFRKKNVGALVVEHYVGASEGTGSATAVIRHVLEEIREQFSIDEEIPATTQDLVRAFPSWLFRAEHLARETGNRVLIVIDAVNQLGEYGRRLDWLPKTIPDRIKLVVSTTPGGLSQHLLERGWDQLNVTPLEDERVRQSIVVRCLGEFKKGVSADQLRRLTRDPKASSPLYLRVVAEELRLHGEHESLDEQIDLFTKAESLLNVFDSLLHRLEQDFGVAPVSELLTLIETSRSGLSETDLLSLTGFSRLEVSRLLFALDYHLIRKDGLLGFFHEYLRRAVRERYMSDDSNSRQLHLRLGDYFSGVDVTQQSASARLWGYLQGWHHQKLALTLGDLDVLNKVYHGIGTNEVLSAWSRLRDTGYDPVEIYMSSLSTREGTVGRDELSESTSKVASVLNQLGFWESGLELLRKVLGFALEQGDPTAIARAEVALGGLLYKRGEDDEAIELLEHALAKSEDIGLKREVSSACVYLAHIASRRGDLDGALRNYQRQLEIGEELGDRGIAAHAIGNIGTVYHSQGEHQKALDCYQQSSRECENLGDLIGLSNNFGCIGNVYDSLREYDRALEAFKQQLNIAEELGDRWSASRAMGNMGNVHYGRGNLAKAEECYERHLSIARKIGQRSGISVALGNVGTLCHARGEFGRALEHLDKAIREHREIGYREAEVNCLIPWIDTLLLLHDLPTAPDYLHTYLPWSEPEEWRTAILQNARSEAENAITISTDLSLSDMLVTAQVCLARVEAFEGDEPAARDRLTSALGLAQDDEERAVVHFWSWKLSYDQDGNHHAEAVRIYTALYENLPFYEHKIQLDALRDEKNS